MTLFFSQKSKKTTRAAVQADSSSDKDEEDMIPKEKLARVRKQEKVTQLPLSLNCGICMYMHVGIHKYVCVMYVHALQCIM